MIRPGVHRTSAQQTTRSTSIATKPDTGKTTEVKPKTKTRTPNSGFAKPMTLSPALTAVIGAGPAPRTEVTKRIWDYIKAHKLQDAEKRTLINADDKLFAVFDKRQVTTFEMTRLVNAHLS